MRLASSLGWVHLLKVPWGQALLASMTEGVNQLLSYGDAIGFLFGGLVAEGIGFTFALKVLPIIVFASLIAVLCHVGIEMDRPDHWGWPATRARHLSGGIEVLLRTSSWDKLRPPGGQAVHCDDDPVRFFAVMVGVGVRRGFSPGSYALIGCPSST